MRGERKEEEKASEDEKGDLSGGGGQSSHDVSLRSKELQLEIEDLEAELGEGILEEQKKLCQGQVNLGEISN